MSEVKHYGHGRWPQAQFYAIVASYHDKGVESYRIAAKLGVSVRLVDSVFRFLDGGAWEQEPSRQRQG